MADPLKPPASLMSLPDEVLLPVADELMHPYPFTYLQMPKFFFRWPELSDAKPQDTGVRDILSLNRHFAALCCESAFAKVTLEALDGKCNGLFYWLEQNPLRIQQYITVVHLCFKVSTVGQWAVIGKAWARIRRFLDQCHRLQSITVDMDIKQLGANGGVDGLFSPALWPSFANYPIKGLKIISQTNMPTTDLSEAVMKFPKTLEDLVCHRLPTTDISFIGSLGNLRRLIIFDNQTRAPLPFLQTCLAVLPATLTTLLLELTGFTTSSPDEGQALVQAFSQLSRLTSLLHLSWSTPWQSAWPPIPDVLGVFPNLTVLRLPIYVPEDTLAALIERLGSVRSLAIWSEQPVSNEFADFCRQRNVKISWT